MAEPRHARVLADLSDEESGALLALQLEGHPEIVLQGGRYIIINTGLENAEGKLIKRAYSLFAPKPEAQQFFLAAAPVADGIASGYLASLKAGDVITFSGPWGRFHWPAEAEEDKMLAFAFGSGITGVLSYIATLPHGCAVEFYWYKDEYKGLVSEDIVRECAAHVELELHHRDMRDDPILDLHAMDAKTRFVAAGEGTRIDRCVSFLKGCGYPESQIQTDIFYRSQDQSDAKADR
ncbi:MAG TPA: FAD-dependent oxidoreductase [Oligoflexus sp.]|uniref:FAD-dependent oxidoreductase n=1 Tax=Oligoflexus sp. TaxID=1971216 RepID=UPI002D236457|nr:FAD-dependent oxidoreductase [Oligoflexus sp.]HYX35489.1 FAD-dependent oxidoreductase [Oligoflexus sp.]